MTLVNNRSNRFEACALLAILISATMLAACSKSVTNGATASTETLSAAAQLGQKIFFDTALSVSGKQSCSTCHVPTRAFAGDDNLSVPLGGPNMDLPGFRNAPSLMYASFTPAFFFASDGTPTGGFMRDGREASLATQAQGPFLRPFEMANSSPDEVIQRLESRPYLQDFINLYGAAVLNDSTTALADMGAAIAAFEKEAVVFHPFSSKFDFFQQGLVQLTSLELNGLRLYNDPTRGNCAACHPSTGVNGLPPLFTDFTYDDLGVPRNTNIAANDDSTALSYVPQNGTDGIHLYYDQGLCGPLRVDLDGNTSGLCGAFKVPTLRNIALTAPYFHNGQFNTLQNVLSFYVTRDTDPSHWYPTDVSGSVTKFDDLEALYGGQFVINRDVIGSDAGYVGNVNTLEIPYNRHLGDAPSLNSDEITAVIAFLCTLTDGYDLAHPENYSLPAQCPQTTASL